MLTNTSLVSIITPSYNHAPYIRQTIDSVLAQEHQQIEHLVIDGGSTDGTVQILMEYESRFPERFRWLSEPDRGQSHAFNKGLAMARGEIIGWQNSDDYYYPNTLGALVEALDADPAIDAVYGDSDRVDEACNRIGVWQGQKYDYRELLQSNYIPNQAALIRKRALTVVGGLRENLHYTMDYDLWLRLGIQGKMLYQPGIVGAYRILPTAKSSAGWARNRQEVTQIMSGLSIHSGLSPDDRALAASQSLKHAAEELVICLTDGSADTVESSVRRILNDQPEVLNWDLLLDECLRDALRTVEEGGGRYRDMIGAIKRLPRLVAKIKPEAVIPYQQISATSRLVSAIQGEGLRRVRMAHVLGAFWSYPPILLSESAWGAVVVSMAGKESTDQLRKARVSILRVLAQAKPVRASARSQILQKTPPDSALEA